VKGERKDTAVVKIGRYDIVEELGKGAMGIVYKAHDPNLDIDVALKVLRKDRIASEPFVRRFIAEARALGRLDHPEIVRVFNVDRDGDNVFIAMELISGTPISALMKQEPASAAAVADFAVKMAQTLDYAHRKGIIHRDVKPSNILSLADGKLKVTDFGIARIEDPSRAEETQAGEILGTPAYMSPEQVLGRPVDGRSDLFSLGIILYEMATGSRPFQGDGISALFNAITNAEPPPIHSINAAIPRPLSDAIMKCLRKSPQQRYADGREMAVAITAAAAPAAPAAPAPAGTGKKAAAPRQIAIAAGSVAVLSVAALLIWRGAASSPPRDAVTVAAPPAVQSTSEKTAHLKAETIPAGATIAVDGSPAGLTPAAIALAPGKHELVIALPGYEKWEAQVEMEKEVETPVSVALLPAEGR
jgi:eukaryotic-like serine/threonine-protein kinase